MELIRLEKEIVRLPNPVVASIGLFDGLHKGHLVLLNETIKEGKENNLKTAVITFDPHPDFVLKKTDDHFYITPFEDKKRLIEEMGFDYLIVIEFDLELANMEPIDFVRKYLSELNVVRTVVGYDFRFGKKGKGKAEDICLLSNGAIHNTVIEKVELDGEKVASEIVKKSLVNGDVKKANLMLGRYYEVTGKVIYGKQLGKTVNVPTANVEFDPKYTKLSKGVYVTIFCVDGEQYIAITNIGHNPTFNYSEKRSMEAHIINFDKNIYDKVVTVKFIEKIRDEIKFPSIEDFQKQIEKDKEYALSLGLLN